jgi:hypothetical protein
LLFGVACSSTAGARHRAKFVRQLYVHSHATHMHRQTARDFSGILRITVHIDDKRQIAGAAKTNSGPEDSGAFHPGGRDFLLGGNDRPHCGVLVIEETRRSRGGEVERQQKGCNGDKAPAHASNNRIRHGASLYQNRLHVCNVKKVNISLKR